MYYWQMGPADLLISAVQQLGLVVGAGAEALLLFAYLATLRAPDFTHQVLVRTSRYIQGSGLGLMVISGVGAVATHILGGTPATILEPAFIFKWILILVLLTCFIEEGRWLPKNNLWLKGFTGATWVALLILHGAAPVASWAALGLTYGALVLVAMALWYGLVRMMRPAAPIVQKAETPKVVSIAAPTGLRDEASPNPTPPPQAPIPAPLPVPKPLPPPLPPKPVPVAPPPPNPVVAAPLPVVAPKSIEPPAPPKPVPPLPSIALAKEGPASPTPVAPPPPQPTTTEESPDGNPDLPAIRVMPKTPADISKQFRGGTVEL